MGEKGMSGDITFLVEAGKGRLHIRSTSTVLSYMRNT